MKIWKNIVVAFSMFSALPMPQIAWDRDSMRYSLCAFPLIGVVIGALCILWQMLCAALALPAILRGAGLCLLPVFVTGGIHLDGYADTCDAMASHASPERRQEILKDPHVGAFAVIRLCSYFVLSLALWSSVGTVRPAALLGLFGLSRSLSGLALTLFPIREGSGLARSFAEAADWRTARCVLGIEGLLFAVLLCVGGGVLAVIAAALVFLRYREICEKDFGGLSGDLAGWFLQSAELWMLAALLLTELGRAFL